LSFKPPLFAMLIAMAAAAAPPLARAVELIEMVRSLNRYQLRGVLGDETAYRESLNELSRIEAAIPLTPSEETKQEKSLRAIATYLLCGGSPAAVRQLFVDGVLDESGAPIVAGALAYAEGRTSEASRLLEPINATGLPVTLAGHLSLVQGGILLRVDKRRAIERFDLARLLMPGSLVEEAALRRELLAIDVAADVQRYLLLARRYAGNYARSPFARDFVDTIHRATVRNALTLPPDALDQFEGFLAAAGNEAALNWRFALMRAAVLNKRPDLAAGWFAKAEKLARSPGAKSRLALYGAAIKAETGAAEEGLELLRNVPAAGLSDEEIQIRDILGAVLARKRRAPEATSPPASAPAPSVATPQTKPNESPIVSAIRESLANTDALLKRRGRR
jgi:chemotaxis protein MotC